MAYVLGYGRVSTLDLARMAGDEFDVAASQQRRRLEKAGCDEIFFDIQRGTDDDRPNFERLMLRVNQRDKCDRVVITRDDRITRNVSMTLQILEAFHKSKVELHILDEGDRPIDLSNPYEWKRRVSAGVDSQFEVKMLSLRVRRGYEDLRAQKKGNPSCPFGYQRSKAGFYEPHPTEFLVARFIIETYLRTGSINATNQALYDSYGLQWTRFRMRLWLANEVLRGNTPRLQDRRTSKPTEIDYETHPELAIVSSAEDVKICDLLSGNQVAWQENQKKRLYPMGGGLCSCDRCGSPMTCRKKYSVPGKYRYPENYYYLDCGNAISKKRGGCDMRHSPSGRLVEGELIKALTGADQFIAEFATMPDQVIEPQELRDLRRQLVDLEKILGSNPAINLAKDSLKSQIKNLEAQLEIQSSRSNHSIELFKSYGEVARDPNFWWQLPDEIKINSYKVFVKSITIDGIKQTSSRRIDYRVDVELSLGDTYPSLA